MLVTVGATEAVSASILALCEAGDEVVVFEPYYDSYAAAIALSGARRVAGRAPSDRRWGPILVRSGRASGRDHAAHPGRSC